MKFMMKYVLNVEKLKHLHQIQLINIALDFVIHQILENRKFKAKLFAVFVLVDIEIKNIH